MVFPIKNAKINIIKKTHSSGYLKDLAYLSLANSFFKNAKDDILKDNPYIVSNQNQDKELVSKVKDQLSFYISSIDSIIEAPTHTKEDSKKYDKFCTILKKEFLKSSHKKVVSFELVGIYLIFSRLVEERTFKVDDSFLIIKDRKRLMTLANIVVELEGEIYSTEWDICYKLSKVL